MRRATYKGKSMSQELANRSNMNPAAQKAFVGRKEYTKKPAKPMPMRGLGRC